MEKQYLNKFKKRILKQYGKNIKAFEKVTTELKAPSKEIIKFRERTLKETKGKLNLNNHNPMISIFHKRYGFASKKENKITCYDDLLKNDR